MRSGTHVEGLFVQLSRLLFPLDLPPWIAGPHTSAVYSRPSLGGWPERVEWAVESWLVQAARPPDQLVLCGVTSVGC